MNRAAAALWGLAIGDALGMPTQSLSPAEIVSRFGPWIEGFLPGPDGHPLAAGLPAGHVTDDTEQAVLLGELLVASGGRVDARELARRLVAWEARMRERGSLDLLGPSTRRAVAALAAGASFAEAVPVAVEAARRGARRGRWVAAAEVGARIGWVTERPRSPRWIQDLVGTGLATQESVPAAFAVLAATGGDPWEACRVAAALGGDTDTIAAMAGAIGGACGGGFPASAIATVRAVNGLDLDPLAAALVELR